ncbi:MAG: RNA pseudouridine synthase [Myxococcales bacterium]|nr:RNA pseudouridine synthase [Myxococcales bacterium]
MIAVDKPAGVIVNETETSGAATVVDQLRWQAPFVVHRLDRGTTGVLLLAKHGWSAAALGRSFEEREVRKIYVAIATGLVEDQRVSAAIGPDPRRPRARKLRPDGKDAITHLRSLEVNGPLSCVEARPETGRTHQIRVHLAAVELRSSGDLLYGGVDSAHVRGTLHRSTRPLLHAFRLSFSHRGRDLDLMAPMPADMLELFPSLADCNLG